MTVTRDRHALATATTPRRSMLARQRARAGYAFIVPNLVGIGVFMLFPLAFSLYLSFHEWDLFSAPEFVGLENFQRLLTSDPLFYIALRNTVVFTVVTIVPTVVISLAAAAALNRNLAGIAIFRTMLFMPLVASTVAMAVIWRWIFNTDNGLLNIMLGWVGIDPVEWLTDPNWALFALCIVSVWKGVPFATVILLAAMQGVPEQLYESAKIDGANGLRRFFGITMPLIRGAISFVFVISIINSFQAFDQAYVLTDGQGGPETGTYVFGIMLFQNAFKFYEMGYASALAWIIFAMLLVLTYLQLRFARKEASEV